MSVPLSDADVKVLSDCQERLKDREAKDAENRRLALDDLEFVAIEGKQWPADIRAARGTRPCLTINKMPVFIDQVVGDQRMNRPSIKVIPVDSKADIKTAKIIGGWIKHVQQISRAEIAYDHGFEHAVACGYGAWRVVTKYVSDDSFDQEAHIMKIDNALAVYFGDCVEYDCSDAKYCIIVSDMDKDEYRTKYGAEPIPFNTTSNLYVEGWVTKDKVRVVEYFVKEPQNKTLYLLHNGTTTDKLEEGQLYAKSRKVESYKIMWYLLSGDRILDSREWIGKKYIPVVPCWGRELNVAGKRVIRSLIRNAKDPQRMYNYWQSTDTETIALQPKVPFILTPTQIQGHEAAWRSAHTQDLPYLLVNPDKEAPGWPKRETPPQMSSAMVEKLRETDQEIRDTVGLQRASLGMQSNERSGAALREQKREGDTGTYGFIDNYARSLEHTGRILVDMAPQLLDTERIVRLGLDDGTFDFTTVNVTAPDGEILNNITVGTYDVVVTIGPSFETQRTEARISMQEFMQYYPAAAPVIGDLYAKAMDWQGAEEISERLEFLLPPELKEKIAARRAKAAGDEVQPPTEPPAPPVDPLMEVKLQEEQINLAIAQENLEEAKVKRAQEEEKLKQLQLETQTKLELSNDSIRQAIEEALGQTGGETGAS